MALSACASLVALASLGVTGCAKKREAAASKGATSPAGAPADRDENDEAPRKEERKASAAKGGGYRGDGFGKKLGGGRRRAETAGKPGAFGPKLTRPASAQPAPELPAETPIDPNGRFATTYRPGGGHLAAFDAAVARGIVPTAEREVVANVASRYAPLFPIAPNHSLGIKTAFERNKLAPGGGDTHLRIALRSAKAAAKTHAHLSVHLVMDTSGSMRGNFIRNARAAAKEVVKQLKPGDDFSLTTFSSDASTIIKDGPVAGRVERINQAIDKISAVGGTNIDAGLRSAYAQAQTRSIPKDAIRVVLLLSDGRANGGETNPAKLGSLTLKAFQKGIQTSTFGLGENYDGPLMSRLAKEGAGGYYYLRDSDQIHSALSKEIAQRLNPSATAVEVRVRLNPGVKLLRVYGSKKLTESEAKAVRKREEAADKQAKTRDGIKRDRNTDQKGGMRFFIPAFAANDSHALMLKLRFAPGVRRKNVGIVELRYKDRIAHKNWADEIPLSVDYAKSDADSASSENASVVRSVQAFAAGSSLRRASQLVSLGYRDQARKVLDERIGILRAASARFKEPLFDKDAARIVRLRSHIGENRGLGDGLVLAMLLETASNSHLR